MDTSIPWCHAQRLHNLLTMVTWDEQAVNDKRLELFLKQYGREPGYLIFDDTGIPKKGSGSVGVARQYSGTARENWQLPSDRHQAIRYPPRKKMPGRLSALLAHRWTDDPARCRRSHVAMQTVFKTKTEIAIDLLDRVMDRSLLIRSVLGDADYGRNPDFPEAIEKRQIPYLLAVPACFSVRKIEDVKHAQEELKKAQAASPKGRPRKRLLGPAYTAQVLTEEFAGIRVAHHLVAGWNQRATYETVLPRSGSLGFREIGSARKFG